MKIWSLFSRLCEICHCQPTITGLQSKANSNSEQWSNVETNAFRRWTFTIDFRTALQICLDRRLEQYEKQSKSGIIMFIGNIFETLWYKEMRKHSTRKNSEIFRSRTQTSIGQTATGNTNEKSKLIWYLEWYFHWLNQIKEHQFTEHQFTAETLCQFCYKPLWGINYQGYLCGCKRYQLETSG